MSRQTENQINQQTNTIKLLSLRAGRSVWYDRSVGIAEAAGSNPAPSTLRDSRLFSVIWDLKKKGYSERTLRGYSKRLRMLARSCNLDDPESVTVFLTSRLEWSNTFKRALFGISDNDKAVKIRNVEKILIENIRNSPEKIESFLKHYDLDNTEDAFIFEEWIWQVLLEKISKPIKLTPQRKEILRNMVQRR
jgi:hypothetical protein